MSPERFALIDLGTNTFHLLIVERKDARFLPVLKLKLPVKLGRGGISKGLIAPDAYARALETLAYFHSEIETRGVQHVRAVATSAVRSAENGPDLVADIKARTGIEVEVISGDREAELIFKGVKLALKIGTEPSLIVDIGGGSVEFILCNHKRIIWKQSFELGAQRLMDQFQQSDPITAAEVVALQGYLSQELAPLTQAMKQYGPHTLIGSSGTFDTLCDIEGYRVDQPRTGEEVESELSLEHFYSIYQEILSKTREERLAIPGMIELRVDMIVVACALIDFVLKSYHIQQIRVSAYALKEGLLSELMEAGK